MKLGCTGISVVDLHRQILDMRSLSQSNYLHFHAVFLDTLVPNKRLIPPLWLVLLWEILDPPLYLFLSWIQIISSLF